MGRSPSRVGHACALILDIDGVVLGASAGAAELLGFTVDALIGRPRGALVRETDREHEHELRRRCLTGEPVAPHPAVRLRHDGAPLDVQIALSPIRDADGEITAIAESLRRTARPGAPAQPVAPPAPAPSRELEYRQTLDTLPLLISACTPDGRLCFRSARWIAYTGLSKAETCDTDFQDCLHPDDRAAALAAWRAALAHGEEYFHEYRLRGPDGAYRWFAARAVPLRDADGRLVRWVGANVDIHEARLARDRLAAREQQLATIAAASPGVLCSFRLAADGSQSFPYASPGIEALYGLSPAALTADAAPVFARIPPDDLAAMIASIQVSARTLGPWCHQWRYNHPTRGERWIEGRSMPVPEPDGAIQWHGVVIDITEQRRAAAELRRWADAFVHCAHGIAMGDPRTGRILTCNPAYARLCGSSVEAITDSPIHARYPESTWPDVRDAIALADRVGAARIESPVRRSDGSTFAADLQIVSVRDPKGEVLHRIATIQDISASVHAEQKLRAAKERLDAIVGATPIPLVAIDPHACCVLWNPAAEQLFGWTSDEVLGRQLPMLSPDEQRKLDERLRRVLAGEAVDSFLTRRLTRDGRRLDVRVSLAPLPDETGQRIAVLASYVDLTEHLALEAQVRHAAKMESLGQLAGGIAHDFNNWLTVITACSEQLSRDHEDDPESIELLQEIQSAGERAAALTRQLLAFSRRDVIAPRLLDLNVVVTETERMLRRLLGEDIELGTDLAADLPLVKIDAGQWSQILMNLALNARDAMPRGGRLTVETGVVRLPVGDCVRLTVRDTGAGMEPDVMARIFEPFFTTKDVGKGTGLGLAVVHGIVTQSGGHIEVESEPGRGTCFRIDLPCAARRGEPQPSLTTFHDLCGDETILFVEDEASLRRIAARMLRGHGYTVIEAANGEVALAALAAYGGPIDLLLTDVVMPRMSGGALARAVSSHHPALRVLFTSGYTDDAMLRHGVLAAEVWFLAKPYTIQTLLQKVRQVLGAADPR